MNQEGRLDHDGGTRGERKRTFIVIRVERLSHLKGEGRARNDIPCGFSFRLNYEI
jgi:hypothetical protein